MILCCGEALIDMLPRTTAAGETAFAPHPGGAVFNTALALGRLGTPVGLFTGLSRDLFGTMLEMALLESAVDITPAARSDRPTTLAFVTLASGQASYAFYDENTAGRMLTAADRPPTDATACFFGGISLACEPCGSTYEAMMLERARDTVTMIDPNIRTGFIGDEARYRGRLRRMLAMADIVKVSDEDLIWIAGDADGAALVSERTALVLVTRGADGARVFTRHGTFEVAAHKATVVDTVGAGDTFNAGVLAGLHEAGLLSRPALGRADTDVLHPAVDLGARAAAVTVARAGANPPRRGQL